MLDRIEAVNGSSETILVHHVHTPDIEITGPDTAHGTWAMFDYVDRPEEDGTRRFYQGYGYYEEDYQQIAEQWTITRLELIRLRIDWLGESPPMP